MVLADLAEACDGVERVVGVEPRKGGEGGFGVVPAALAPGAEAKAVEGAEERAVVDQAPGDRTPVKSAVIVCSAMATPVS